MNSTDLDEEVRALLEARRGKWAAVVKDCSVSHSWISQFVRGKITNPGFQTLKQLREYLAQCPQPRADSKAAPQAEHKAAA